MFHIDSKQEINDLQSQINILISDFINKHSDLDKEIKCHVKIRTYDPLRDDKPYEGIFMETFIVDYKALKELDKQNSNG